MILYCVVVSDKNQDGWLIVQVLLSFKEARMLPEITLPDGFDTARELGVLSWVVGAVDTPPHLDTPPPRSPPT